jgi:two-component system phosphate regulon sensor histidine kinase PhoR
MFRNPTNVELPRRVAVYYLLFCTTAAAWFAVGAVEVVRGILSSRAESACLAKLGRAASAIELELLRNGADDLQSEVQRIQREGSLAYCAVVGENQRYLAHTSRPRVGQPFQEKSGERVRWGDVERVRFVNADSRTIREYRAPLRLPEQALGTLHVAVQELGLWRTVLLTAQHAPVATFGAALFIALGAVVMYRTVRPMANIERQLRQLARAPSMSEAELRPIPARGAAALGWNHLVDERGSGWKRPSLDERLSEAVRGLGRQKSDDILNSLSEGVIVTDPDERIQFANQAVAALLNHESDSSDLRGRTMQSCLSFASEQADGDSLFDPQLQARTVVAEVNRPNEQGRQVLRVARHPLRSAERKSSGGQVWTVRDITQQKLAEQMRDQFLDSATHELRTPLANIKAYAETLTLSEMSDIEQQKQFCNTINAEATRLARLIDDLLSVSSMEVGSLSLNRQEVNVERLLRETIGKVSAQMEQKQIAFESVLPEKLPKLNLDKDKIAAALVNLLGNAAKYTPRGGRVTLRVRAEEGLLKIEVEDTGVGISEDELPRVFDKFFRSSDVRIQEETGTGLGLSFAQEVVRLHDGTLSASSQLNQGTTFTLQLPLS